MQQRVQQPVTVQQLKTVLKTLKLLKKARHKMSEQGIKMPRSEFGIN
jgi:hypothetical protein